MDVHFNRIFWGMILVFFNFNIGPIDVLPNIIGVIMIAMALNGLYQTKNEESFKKGEPYGWIMVGFEVVNLVFKFTGYNSMEASNSSILILLYGQIAALIRIILLYYIFKGIFNLGEKYNNLEISTKAKNRWLWSFVSTVGMSIVMAFYLNFQEGILTVLILIFGGISFIVNILLLTLMRTSAKTFVEKDISNGR